MVDTSGLTTPMQLPLSPLSQQVCPFGLNSPPPDTLWTLKSKSQRRPRAHRRITPSLRHGLIDGAYLHSLYGERRGPSSVSQLHHFPQANPPSTPLIIHGCSPTPWTEALQRPQHFGLVRTVVRQGGRNVTPPEVSLPGSFATAPSLVTHTNTGTALATYPSKESSSNDFCTETNPHR